MSETYFSDCNLSPKVLEKACRVSSFSSLILSQILCDGYGFMWMTDKDSIVQGVDRLKFTIKLHYNTLKQYCPHLSDIKKGYAIPFEGNDEPKYYSEDFLSLSDLISGSIDDYANHFENQTPEKLIKVLKPKTIEILSYLKKIPTFIYILDSDGKTNKCRRVNIKVEE